MFLYFTFFPIGRTSKTLMILNVCPNSLNLVETISSLNFGSRARNAVLSLGNRDTIKKWRDIVSSFCSLWIFSPGVIREFESVDYCNFSLVSNKYCWFNVSTYTACLKSRTTNGLGMKRLGTYLSSQLIPWLVYSWHKFLAQGPTGPSKKFEKAQ